MVKSAVDSLAYASNREDAKNTNNRHSEPVAVTKQSVPAVHMRADSFVKYALHFTL